MHFRLFESTFLIALVGLLGFLTSSKKAIGEEDFLPSVTLAPSYANALHENSPELETSQNASKLKDAEWISHSAQIPLYFPDSQINVENASLALSDVIASVYRAFPIIEQARLQANIAGGEQIAAHGAYDTKLQGYTLNQPIGFYETYRHGLGAARQLWWGQYGGKK